MSKEWNGKRYNSLNYFLREKFGEKVFKISLDGGFSCPNRDVLAALTIASNLSFVISPNSILNVVK